MGDFARRRAEDKRQVDCRVPRHRERHLNLMAIDAVNVRQQQRSTCREWWPAPPATIGCRAASGNTPARGMRVGSPATRPTRFPIPTAACRFSKCHRSPRVRRSSSPAVGGEPARASSSADHELPPGERLIEHRQIADDDGHKAEAHSRLRPRSTSARTQARRREVAVAQREKRLATEVQALRQARRVVSVPSGLPTDH